MRTCWKLKLAISSVAKFHLIGNAVSVLIGFFISFRIGFPRCTCPSYHEDQTIPFEEGLRLIPRRPLSNSFETYPKKINSLIIFPYIVFDLDMNKYKIHSITFSFFFWLIWVSRVLQAFDYSLD